MCLMFRMTYFFCTCGDGKQPALAVAEPYGNCSFSVFMSCRQLQKCWTLCRESVGFGNITRRVRCSLSLLLSLTHRHTHTHSLPNMWFEFSGVSSRELSDTHIHTQATLIPNKCAKILCVCLKKG